jgi:tRNA-modifying protein YgfZ
MKAVPLPYLSAATVEGPDAGAFLQAQLSSEISSLSPGSSRFSCYCSPRGRVYGLLLVGRLADQFLLVGAADLLPDMVARLRGFVLRSRLTLAPAASLAVLGLPDDVPDDSTTTWTLRAEGSRLRYRVAVAGDATREGTELWKSRELAAGVAWLNPGTTERFIPQMLGFDTLGAVSFRKGCFPGQEVIARARYLGQVKRRPLPLRVEGSLAAEAGSALKVRADGRWLDATVIDSAAIGPNGEQEATTLFAIAPESAGLVDALEYADRSYRCATI